MNYVFASRFGLVVDRVAKIVTPGVHSGRVTEIKDFWVIRSVKRLSIRTAVKCQVLAGELRRLASEWGTTVSSCDFNRSRKYIG